MTSSVGAALSIGVGIGVSNHYTFFIKGEWHLRAPMLLALQSFVLVAGALTQTLLSDPAIVVIAQTALAISCGHLLGLFTSIVSYRALFHPLNKLPYPGPMITRLTKLWHIFLCCREQNHEILGRLHRQYGDFVRTGPSEITIFDPDIYAVLDGPSSTFQKSEWYDLLHPWHSLITERNRSVHAIRRREWNQAFTTKAMEHHRGKIVKYTDQLEEVLRHNINKGDDTDARDLFFWYGFDIMGDVVFSKSFGMLLNQRWHYVILRLQEAVSLLGPLTPAPWLVQIGFHSMPRLGPLKAWFEMAEFCEMQTRERVERGPCATDVPDLTHFLMKENGNATPSAKAEQQFWITGDSILAIIAGSDPTATVIMGIFAELAKHPEYQSKLFEELQTIDRDDIDALAGIELLNMIIKEALRLYPVLPTGGQRKTTEGVTFKGHYIPPNTTVVAPRYVISRSESSFQSPDEFLPDRWSKLKGMVHKENALVPFSIGHHSCVGRPLAMEIMRLVTARVVRAFTFDLADGENGTRIITEMIDQFVSFPGPLNLDFKPRA